METSVDAIFGNRLQINNLPSPDERGNIAAAVVSIGGNDANFSEVAKGCLVPGSCDELRELWLGNLEAIGPRLRDTYREIKMALPGVPIVVVPYPLMLTEEGCGWSLLDEREHTFLSEFVTALNEQVRVAAAREGVNFVTEAMFAFEDNRICDGDDADSTVMNFVNLRPTGGSFGERLNPGNWVHGSMHPKPSGHVETARVVERWLRDHLANVEGGAAANPAPLPNTKLEVLSLRGQVAVLIDAKALNLPVDLECSIAIAGEGDAVIDPFGTRIPVIDDPRAYPAPVRITDADATAPVCVTSADTGEWIVLPQSANAPVQIKLTPPTYLTVSGEDEDTQSVLYRSSDGTWQVRLIQYCSRNDRCASSVSAWMNGQLASAGRTAAPAFVLLILGGWLFAVASSPKSFFRSWRLNAEEAVDAFNTDRSEVGR